MCGGAGGAGGVGGAGGASGVGGMTGAGNGSGGGCGAKKAGGQDAQQFANEAGKQDLSEQMAKLQMMINEKKGKGGMEAQT